MPFLKIEKNVLIFERKPLIVFIFGLNYPFKMQFYKDLGEKTPKCFHAACGASFMVFFD